MIVGDPNRFALESKILQAYERLSLRALGFFVIHVGGRCYGVKEDDATMLAIALDGIKRRIASRGAHSAPAIADSDAETLAISFSRAIYIDHEKDALFLGMLDSEFRGLLYSNDIVWAPDGDEGFDDGGCVLQFDIGDMVRLVAFSRATNPVLDSESLRDVVLPQGDFYGILKVWYQNFENQWISLPKQADANQ